MPQPSPSASPMATSVRPQSEPAAEPDAMRQPRRNVAVFPHMVSAGPEDSPSESREGEEPLDRRCSPSSSVVGERPDRPGLPDLEEGEALAPEHEAALQDLQRVLQLLGGEELTLVAGELCKTTRDTVKAFGGAQVHASARGARGQPRLETPGPGNRDQGDEGHGEAREARGGAAEGPVRAGRAEAHASGAERVKLDVAFVADHLRPQLRQEREEGREGVAFPLSYLRPPSRTRAVGNFLLKQPGAAIEAAGVGGDG